jgi:hypothetical protein
MKGGIEEAKKTECRILLSLSYLNHKSQGGSSMKPIGRLVMMAVVLVLALFTAHVGFAAYNHAGDTDSVNFRTVYPDKVGTKLDSCTLCHSGGSYESGGKTTVLGSCQWCHYKYGYDASGNIDDTLNPYGKDYLKNGRNDSAIQAINNLDSDSDGYPNAVEIAATRFPGDPKDDPSKVPAPFRVFTREQLDQMPQHTQFLLMNASKSTDNYAQYTGVPMGDLLNEAELLPSATDIYVSAPDGFGQTHPLYPDTNPSVYHVFGDYPAAIFYYNEVADITLNTAGWCDYSAPSVIGRNGGDPIVNPDGLKMLLAIKREGQYLVPGVLNDQNKLDGEGPFRVVPPQKNPGPPDQRSTASNPSLPWPYDKNADHNAGFSSRSVTIIKVEPLPEGTTDIDLLEAGWSYIDANKIVVYGAIDPVPTILEKLDALETSLGGINGNAFKYSSSQNYLINRVKMTKKHVMSGGYRGAFYLIHIDVLRKTNGCVITGVMDGNDLVTDCNIQKQLYWAINEIMVLINILM